MAIVLNQTVQWHITEVCPNRCKHCYIGESNNAKRRGEELVFKDMISILDNLDEFAETYGVNIKSFAITGGDPFEHSDFEKLLEELHKRGKNIQILGIPERITKESLRMLEKYNVKAYQVSLDGLEETHDLIRGQGSFSRTIKALSMIGNMSNIAPYVMFTLHKRNYQEMFEVIDFLHELNIKASFAFDFLVQTGSASTNFELLDKMEVLQILKAYRAKRIQLQRKESKLRLREKVKLFETFDVEDVNNKFAKYSYVSGCYCGISSIAILPNGDLLPCRRLPLVVGNLLEQSYETLFLDNPLMRKLRRISSYQMCFNCDYAKICRGCPAVAYATTGEVFSELAYCSMKKEVIPLLNEPPLDCDKQTEFAFLTNNPMRAMHDEGVLANVEAVKYQMHKELKYFF